MTKLEELKKRHAELRAQIVSESKVFFAEQAKAIFDKHPAIQEFSWTQYTPYFNDGDTCEFRVNSWSININGEDEYENKNPAIAKEVYGEVEAFISAIDEDTMKEMFGDHCKVIARRDGSVDVEEYSHD